MRNGGKSAERRQMKARKIEKCRECHDFLSWDRPGIICPHLVHGPDGDAFPGPQCELPDIPEYRAIDGARLVFEDDCVLFVEKLRGNR